METKELNQFIGFLETINDSGFVGWAYRSGNPEPLELKLLIDGQLAKTFTCIGIRLDVAQQRHDLAEIDDRAKVGFSIEVPREYLDDVRHFYDFLDAEGLPVPIVPLGSCAATPGEFCLAAIRVFGAACASLDEMRIAGWAVVLDQRTTHKRVANDIEISNAWGKALLIRADVERLDVARELDCEPECGFEVELPENFITHVSPQVFIRVLPENISFHPTQVSLSESSKATSARGGQEVMTDWPVTEAVQPALDDSDDPRVRSTAFPRSELFRLDDTLSDLRAKLLPSRAVARPTEYSGHIERSIADYFDSNYYLAAYKDIAVSGIDPLIHFVEHGWREGRRPTDWFDTAYYLDANPDIKTAGVNPFWHYLVIGRQEGRRTVRLGGRRRTTLESVVDPKEKTRHYMRMKTIPRLLKDRLIKFVSGSLENASGVAISFSQDCYVEATGGIQLFIADEQRAYALRSFSYLNVSPLDPDLVLAGSSSRAYYKLVLDGKYVGIASHSDLVEALSASKEFQPTERVLIVHCLLGHNVERTLELADVFKPSQSAFWIHDYSSICPGYNLLRNDVEYCGAPSVGSVCCRICVYGDLRPEHVSEYKKLFEKVSFVVVAPSRAALDIWMRSSDLPYQRAVVHSHCSLDETSVRVNTDDAKARGLPESPLRIAFVGYPASHKGWPLFEELVSRVKHLPCYQFFHFLSGGEQFVTDFHIERVAVRTTADHRDAMTQALAMYAIDLVLMPAPWPETFSYVTFEALAAGADIIALGDSGNVADAILQLGRGIVVADEAAFLDLFTSLRVIQYMRIREEQGIVAGELNHSGTTATLSLVAQGGIAHV